jgi:uncharacterized protein
MLNRREFLAAITALLGAPALAHAASSDALDKRTAVTRLAASWQAGHGYQVGMLSLVPAEADGLNIAAAVDVPTRAHGLLQEPGGTLLAVARRPGDWLLRWNGEGQAVTWQWIEPRRAFAGHVLGSADGRTLYTTEMDLDSGTGLIGVRDVATLQKRAEWPTHGIDPHQLMWDRSSRETGKLIVANGGVPTQPETGRVKRKLERMDSSMVRLDARTGDLNGQWRLDDRRLSLRHLAWGEASGQPVLGIALQAEHDDPNVKANAPVLALFDGRSLRSIPLPQAMSGYGGDIAALGGRFAVSCPRASSVALFDATGVWLGHLPLPEAGALTSVSDRLWVAGRLQALGLRGVDAAGQIRATLPGLRLDNHWIALG